MFNNRFNFKPWKIASCCRSFSSPHAIVLNGALCVLSSWIFLFQNVPAGVIFFVRYLLRILKYVRFVLISTMSTFLEVFGSS